MKRVLLLVVAVTIHNFPEGLAVGVAFGAAAQPGSKHTVAAAIALAVGKGPSPSECLGEVELELPAYGVAHLSGFGYE